MSEEAYDGFVHSYSEEWCDDCEGSCFYADLGDGIRDWEEDEDESA